MAYNLAILFRQTYVQTGDTPGDIAGIGIPQAYFLPVLKKLRAEKTSPEKKLKADF